MRDDAAFAQTADTAARAIFDTLGMGGMNPFFSATISFEVAETLRRTGERNGALAALERAVKAVIDAPVDPDTAVTELWDHLNDCLDPARFGEAWAEHKAHQVHALCAALRQNAAERSLSPEWRAFANDDARYQKMVASLS